MKNYILLISLTISLLISCASQRGNTIKAYKTHNIPIIVINECDTSDSWKRFRNFQQINLKDDAWSITKFFHKDTLHMDTLKYHGLYDHNISNVLDSFSINYTNKKQVSILFKNQKIAGDFYRHISNCRINENYSLLCSKIKERTTEHNQIFIEIKQKSATFLANSDSTTLRHLYFSYDW